MDKMVALESLLIRDLRVLLTLAERKHFALAAQEFGISQPSLSAIVKKVESVYGVTLFNRNSRRFEITPEGEEVIRQTRAVVEEITRLAAVLDGDSAALVGRFRLGVIPTLGPYYIPRFLAELRNAYPQVELVLVEAKTDTLLSQLRQREIDAAILALPVSEPGLDAAPLFREPFVLAVPDDHELARQDSVTVQDVELRELLILEQGNCLSDQTLDACGARRAEEARPIHATSLETLRFMVAARLGIAILPKLAACAAPAPELALSYVPFRAPQPARVLGLVSRRHSTRRRDVQALGECLRAHLPDDLVAA